MRKCINIGDVNVQCVSHLQVSSHFPSSASVHFQRPPSLFGNTNESIISDNPHTLSSESITEISTTLTPIPPITMYTTVIATLLFSTLASAAPSLTLIARAEVHEDVTFTPISNYGDTTGPVQKVESFGSCGEGPEFQMSDAAGHMRVALASSTPDASSYCGKSIRLTNPDGRTAEVTIVDMCVSCSPFGLDLLEAPWQAVGSMSSLDPVSGAKWETI